MDGRIEPHEPFIRWFAIGVLFRLDMRCGANRLRLRTDHVADWGQMLKILRKRLQETSERRRIRRNAERAEQIRIALLKSGIGRGAARCRRSVA